MNSNSAAVQTAEDMEAPLPYIRRHPDFKPEETKFEFEYTEPIRKTVQKKALNEKGELQITETYTEETEITKRKKVYLKCFGNTSKEDGVVFFQCFNRMLKELAVEVRKCSQAKERDASILFQATDKMLIGAANANWLTVLNSAGTEAENVDNTGTTKTTWEVYKRMIAKYICTQVYTGTCLYDQQVEYMQSRHKPKSMTAKEWHRTFQEYNNYMCYLFPDLAAMKRQFLQATFKEWMARKAGALTPAQERRVILEKVKENWRNALKLHDIGRVYREQKSPEDIVDYYTTLEGLEQNRARQTSNGGQMNRGRPNNFSNNNPRTAGQARSGFRPQGRGRPVNRNANNYFTRELQGRRGQGYNQQQRQQYNQRANFRNNNNGGNRNNNNRYQNNNYNRGNGNHNQGGVQRHGNGHGNPQPQQVQSSNFQGQNFRSRYQRPSGQAFFQDDESQRDASADSASESGNSQGEVNQLDPEPIDQQEVLTEAQWMERWNEQAMENLYLDASEESAGEDDENFAIEDSDDDYNGGVDYAALDGSGYL